MRTKRKSRSHIIDKQAIQIVESIFPNHWTIREYKPDYGIDLEVELFEKKQGDEEIYDTLGEHIFIQVKGTESLKNGKYRIFRRKNVEKYIFDSDEEFENIDVVKHPIDTVELFTIERMSNSIPVLLFVVDINNEDIYYVCMNDYIEKVIIPENPRYYDQGKLTINIPLDNKLDRSENSLWPIKFYAKRPKLYSFFNKVSYQNDELHHFSEDTLLKTYQHFLNILLRLDVWSIREQWPAMGIYFKQLVELREQGKIGISLDSRFDDINSGEKEWETDYSFGELYSFEEVNQFRSIRILWETMANLRNIYKECCREWLLPTFFYYGSVNS